MLRMETIVFATHNQNKLNEIKSILKERFNVVGLTEIGCTEEIPENGATIAENAAIKARFVYEKYNLNCFADDTGLEVDALNGEPGVFSARYAGEPTDSVKNMEKLLFKLKNNSNRKARFRTVIVYVENGISTFSEGVVEGNITESKKGEKGFGYDPIFKPDGYKVTFAEMGSDEKNKISHRAKATQLFLQYLDNK